jgi:hypothetical protein
LLAVAIAHTACTDAPTAAPDVTAPSLKKGGGGNGGGGDDTGLAVTLTGNLSGTEQTVSGRTHTPAVGTLDVKYDKTAPDPRRIDSWTVTIGEHDYWVQFFRWASSELTEADGATVVDFTGGSIVVFKKQGGKYVSREQCFGEFVDYDLTVR